MMPKDTQTSIPESQEEFDGISLSESSVNEPDENNDQLSQDEAIEVIEPTKRTEFKSPLKRNREKQKRDEMDDKLLDIERQKFSLFSKAADEMRDDDYQYLMSLLPYLRKVPRAHKLQARVEMMNVLVKYTTPQCLPLSSQHMTSSLASPPSSLHSESSSNLQEFYSTFNPAGAHPPTFHQFQ
ncbi:unnamed protein product [Acanthoscelides obtectus]|uniref:BESS domain-containing protein n=1 Tax=Acanthoscelides obtectus TaxID=200917 RepID=A0A9P0P9H8_ACAOB|nr:unnamed protein product [Acanthoscelides obtectus]CAH2015241.1 unnamed protein product [Acanthoscelides obtectus]CAK1671707.1 hypothetical protein AOBTE_LOCUS28410 [Acanthoscelides obtectus]CAK1671838.1 hypothetical protein AOBTE_LOCUS28490 [Acanthoscelides obtectus]